MSKQNNDVANDVRRKLLKAVVYAPPVILGSMVATPRMAIGAIGAVKQCQLTGGLPPVQVVISSGTNACCPCIPNAVKWDPAKCSKYQCVKSCGTLCTPGQIVTIKCKDFCKNCGVTPAGCRKACKSCLPDPKKPGQFKCK